MNRNDWIAKYPGSKLAEGARAQLAFRKGRLEAWEKKKAEIMQEVKEKGLSVHEDVEEEMYKLSNNVGTSGRVGATITVDRALQADLYRCMERIQRNRGKIGEYEGWAQMLGAHTEDVFELDIDDWNYFFGKVVGTAEV